MNELVTREWVEETFEYTGTDHSEVTKWLGYAFDGSVELYYWAFSDQWALYFYDKDGRDKSSLTKPSREAVLAALSPFLKKKPMRTITVEVPHDFPEPPEGGTYRLGFAEKKGSYWFTSAGWSTNLFDDSCPTAVLHCVPASKPFNPLDHVSSDTMVAFKTRNGEKAWVTYKEHEKSTYPLRGIVAGDNHIWLGSGAINGASEHEYDLVALWEEE